jgi:hypothetical protein
LSKDRLPGLSQNVRAHAYHRWPDKVAQHS